MRQSSSPEKCVESLKEYTIERCKKILEWHKPYILRLKNEFYIFEYVDDKVHEMIEVFWNSDEHFRELFRKTIESDPGIDIIPEDVFVVKNILADYFLVDIIHEIFVPDMEEYYHSFFPEES